VDLEAGPVVQGVIRDITSRKLAEEAQGRMVLVGQLATGVAHDLGNVLSGIKIWARLSKEGTANDDQVVESLISAADEGAAIVRGLMALARTGEHPAVEHLCIEKVIEPALTVVGRQLTTTGVEVLREYVSEGPFVAVDPAQMGRVFLNLAVNAGQAMPAGGTLTVETRYLSSASGVGEVVVTVTDTGRGIAPEHLPHVFEPFFTTKAASGASEVPGTGLGLSVARDIVAAHGGTITVRSEVGAGTTFEIRLPVNTETTAEE